MKTDEKLQEFLVEVEFPLNAKGRKEKLMEYMAYGGKGVDSIGAIGFRLVKKRKL